MVDFSKALESAKQRLKETNDRLYAINYWLPKAKAVRSAHVASQVALKEAYEEQKRIWKQTIKKIEGIEHG